MPIEYSEYKSLIDILENSSNPNSTTYEDLMQKEKNILSTVNHVVKNVQDKNNNQFTNMSIEHIAHKFFLIWPEIFRDLSDCSTPQEYYLQLTKDDRIIYYGIAMIVFGLIVFFVQSSS